MQKEGEQERMFKKLNQAGWYTPIIPGNFLGVKLQSEI